MASTNQSPFYQRAEAEYHKASSDLDRIACLEIMVRECPKHKSSENMLKNLTLRLKKLKTNLEKQKKSGKSSREGIKKADMQCILVGFPNTGKSTLFNRLTGDNVKTSPHKFTTSKPKLGTFKFEDAKIQIIDTPSFPNHEKGLINNTDTLLLLIDSLDQIKKTETFLYRSKAKVILIFNKEDELRETEKRKIGATLNSKFKDYDYIMISAENSPQLKLDELKGKIFKTFPIIRIYTKEPKKDPTKTPMIMKEGSTLKDSAEKILKGMSSKIKINLEAK